MALEGATPTRLGPSPRHKARGPSTSTMYLSSEQREGTVSKGEGEYQPNI